MKKSCGIGEATDVVSSVALVRRHTECDTPLSSLVIITENADLIDQINCITRAERAGISMVRRCFISAAERQVMNWG